MLRHTIVFIFHVVLRCVFPCHSCSQEHVLAVENTQNCSVEGFFCRGTSLRLRLQQSVSRLTNVQNLNNCGSAVRGESICLEDKRRKLFYVVCITQNQQRLHGKSK